MEENITYAEMNRTTGQGKRQGKTGTVHLQDEDPGVTYAALKKTPGKKKEKSSKRQKGLDPPQNEDITITYAAVIKKTKPKSPQEDTERPEDVTVTYAALRETSEKRSRRHQETQEGPCGEKSAEDAVIIRDDRERPDWRQILFPGRRWTVLLIPFLVTLCLILLITTITGRVSCVTPGPGNGSGSAEWCSSCPDPWILITDKCYFFSEDRKYQKDSKEDCERRNSILATVKEGRILKLVNITAQEFWIGLESLGTYHNGGTWSGRWADGSIENITEGSGSCAKIHRVLSRENCLKDLHWICERDVRTP